MKTKYYIATLVTALVLANLAISVSAADLTSCPGMQGACTLPKSGSSPGIEINAAPIHWTTPAGWKELPATSIRIGNFLIQGAGAAKAEVAVTSFPGTVGTEYDNVNRWRGELGLASVDPAEITSQLTPVGASEGKLYEFNGASASTVVVWLRRDGASWFFKLRGDKDVVDSAKPAFTAFLNSIQFTGDTVDKKLAAVPATAPSTAPAASAEPKWNPPASWSAGAAGAMVLKSFIVGGDSGPKAKVTVSVFPGDVGGELANVNRWRAQLGLEPIKQEDLAAATQTLHGVDGDGTLIELANANAPGGALSMVAVIVPHNNSTWFYKLTGAGAVVDREKEQFVAFVQNVQYP